jgi:primosomal protein N' (replication factor Y)
MVASGRANLCTLSHRADHAVLPSVHVVDMRLERKAQRVDGVMSHKALDAIADRVQRGEGTLVFLNRRGYAASMQCEDCGDVPMCTNCDVALTYHKHAAQLKCHYCGYAEPSRTACYVCGSVDLVESGSGTQQIEELVRTAVEQRIGRTLRVDRLDADRTSRKGEHRAILERFQRGEIDVLIGTQMIAKGLDIARVSLVVVVNADQLLHRLDFRATERTVQMLTQLAGRAGRSASSHGEMYIQTSSPDHPAIEAAVLGERSPEALRAWEQTEMSLRRDTSYPPYSRFVRLEVGSLDESRSSEHAKILAALIPPSSPIYVRLDPTTPPIARIRNMYRNVIIIKNDKAADPAGTELRSVLRGALDVYYREYASSHVHVTVDIDAHGTF